MLRTRILTGLIALAAVLALVLFAPNRVFTLFIAAVAAWGLYEVVTMYAAGKPLIMLPLALAGGVPAVLILGGTVPDWLVPAAIIMAVVGLTLEVASQHDSGSHNRLIAALIGALYVGVLTPYFALLRNGPLGIRLIIVMLLVIVAGDTGAYLVGSKWGRIKLAPRVSPGKTVEGTIASLAASLIAMLVLRGFLGRSGNLVQSMILALAINLLAQIGDLAESALKRIAGVKDSGWIFPGHGGLLDRSDSLVLATVFTYYYSR